MPSLSDILADRAHLTGASAQDAPVGRFALFRHARKRQFARWLDRARPLPAGQGTALALAFIIGGWMFGAVVGEKVTLPISNSTVHWGYFSKLEEPIR